MAAGAPGQELAGVGKTEVLNMSLGRAHRLAVERLHGSVSIEHLLLALTDDADARQIFAASPVDLGRLRAELEHAIRGIPPPDAPGRSVLPNGDFLRVLRLAATAAQQSRRTAIDSMIVLAAIIGDGKTEGARLLTRHGLTFNEVIKVLQTPPASRPSAPPSLEREQRPAITAATAAAPPAPIHAPDAVRETQTAQAIAANEPAPNGTMPPAVSNLHAQPAATTRPPTTDELLASVRARLKDAAPPVNSRQMPPPVPSPQPVAPPSPPLPPHLGPQVHAAVPESAQPTQQHEIGHPAEPSPTSPVGVGPASYEPNAMQQAAEAPALLEPEYSAHAADLMLREREAAPQSPALNPPPLPLARRAPRSDHAAAAMPAWPEPADTYSAGGGPTGSASQSHEFRTPPKLPEPAPGVSGHEPVPHPMARQQSPPPLPPPLPPSLPSGVGPDPMPQANFPRPGQMPPLSQLNPEPPSPTAAPLQAEAPSHTQRLGPPVGAATAPVFQPAQQQGPGPYGAPPHYPAAQPPLVLPMPIIDLAGVADELPARLLRDRAEDVTLSVPRHLFELGGVSPARPGFWPPMRVVTLTLKSTSGDVLVEPLSPTTNWVRAWRAPNELDTLTWRWRVLARTSGVIGLALHLSVRNVSADGIGQETIWPDEEVGVRVRSSALKRWLGGILILASLIGAVWALLLASGQTQVVMKPLMQLLLLFR